MLIPIKLGNHAIGVFEVANKKGTQDFTTNDYTLVMQLADEIATGLISHEMKYNIKKEFDDEVKYFKGLLNQSYN
jgi:GAF domain-containing protein